MNWDVVVIGAGAAGLLAADCAARRGKRTLLLEKNRKAGVKILMSGGTRCNLTHATDSRGIVEAFGKPGKFLHSALARLSPDDLVTLFAVEGVPTKVEAHGKVFPVSNRALDVQVALLRRLASSNCTLALDEPVNDIDAMDGGFRLTTPKNAHWAPRIIVTTGGQSYPGCGTTGDGYGWAERLGHQIITPRPALVPITLRAEWVKALSGITIPDVALRIIDGGARGTRKDSADYRRRGSLLLTHFGVSGPVALDISRVVSLSPDPTQLVLECDFLPSRTAADLDGELARQCVDDGRKPLARILGEMLPRRLAETLLDLAKIPADRRAASLSHEQRRQLVLAIKQQQLEISGTLTFAKAEVTAGGVALPEVDSRTMQSKLCPGLFFAGEILDLDGPIGGYNFQAAFSTGWLAGYSV